MWCNKTELEHLKLPRLSSLLMGRARGEARVNEQFYRCFIATLCPLKQYFYNKTLIAKR